ncbi:MAG TPA: discoidin domain-containing protein [Thermoguttaceae bacterium]|nr:discoidin domain-containing protein [Thermoguttaceae bacterium]
MRVFYSGVILAIVALALSAGQLQAETVLSNVAAFQPTTGTPGWGYYPTANGNDDSRWMTFTHGEGNGNSYWRVDLGGVRTVDYLNIYCRAGYPQRTNGAILQGYADDGTTPVGPALTLSGYSTSVDNVAFTNGGSPWAGVRYFQVNESGLAPGDPYLHIGEFRAMALVEKYPGFISGVTVTDQYTYGHPAADGDNLVNHSGMSDQQGPLGNPNALHAAVNGDAIWHSDGANNPIATFNLGGTYSLANMVVWNEDQDAGARGINECLLEVSTDGTNFTALTDTNGAGLGNYTLHQITGSGPYAATDNLDLGGLTAGYVRLTGLSSFGSPYYGLDEVRFYAVPEPSMLVLLALGSLVLLGRRK